MKATAKHDGYSFTVLRDSDGAQLIVEHPDGRKQYIFAVSIPRGMHWANRIAGKTLEWDINRG